MAINRQIFTLREWKRLQPLFQDFSDDGINALYETLVEGRNISEGGRMHGISRQQARASYRMVTQLLTERTADNMMCLPIWLPTVRRAEIVALLAPHGSEIGRETPPPGQGRAPSGQMKLRQPRYTATEWASLSGEFKNWRPEAYRAAGRMLVDGLLPVEAAAEFDDISLEYARMIRRRADTRIHKRSRLGRHQALVWVKRDELESIADLLRDHGCLIGGDDGY